MTGYLKVRYCVLYRKKNTHLSISPSILIVYLDNNNPFMPISTTAIVSLTTGVYYGLSCGWKINLSKLDVKRDEIKARPPMVINYK